MEEKQEKGFMNIERGKMVGNQKIKCVVWDLDNTIWEGTLIEDENVTVKKEVLAIISELDKRGILQSIASKNDFDLAMAKLKKFKIDHYFIFPKIHWEVKSQLVLDIAKNINIGIDSLAFVDDQMYELEEVAFVHPEIVCIPINELPEILLRDEFMPEFITEDSKNRRLLYQNDIIRNEIEEQFPDTKEEFLKSLGLIFTIKKAEIEDLQRVYELTIRTNQLNTSGESYTYDELCEFIKNPEYELLIAGMKDKYGDYGKIGIVLLHITKEIWEIKLLLMSCRVMNRGVGTALIGYLIHCAQKANVRLITRFIHTGKNKLMYITYKFCGFEKKEIRDSCEWLEYDISRQFIIPAYVEIDAPEEMIIYEEIPK